MMVTKATAALKLLTYWRLAKVYDFEPTTSRFELLITPLPPPSEVWYSPKNLQGVATMFDARTNPFLAFGLTFQAVALGCVVMVASEVSSRLIATQLGAVFIAAILALLAAMIFKRHSQIAAGIFAILSTVALVLVSFQGCDSEGMRRWICLGPIRLHAASLLLPPLLVCLGIVRVETRLQARAMVFACGTVAALAVAWSSDASYATAFSLGLVVAAEARRRERKDLFYWIALAIVAVLVAFHKDRYIPPVVHTEGILILAWSRSWSLGVVAFLSLLLANMAPLVVWRMFPAANARCWALSLFVLFAIVTLFGFSGIWPVPFLGYGAGPILGVTLALGILWGCARGEQPNHTNDSCKETHVALEKI